MNFPTDFNVKTAVEGRNDFDMQKNHTTSLDFGIIKAIENKICFPGDKLHVSVNQDTLALTMPNPTFGKADIILRAFYVPINNIWRDFDYFISNQKKPSANNTLTSVSAPFIYAGDLWHLISIDSTLCTGVDGDDYDFVVSGFVASPTGQGSALSINDVARKIKLTYKGRKFIDFLVSMGLKTPPVTFEYKFNPSQWRRSDLLFNHYDDIQDFLSSEYEPDSLESIAFKTATDKISVLPLLAFWKFYIDWIVPARYLSAYTEIRHLFEMNLEDALSYDTLIYALTRIPVSFLQDDFFTTLFATPFGYEDSQNVDFGINVPNPENGVVGSYLQTDGSGARVEVKGNDNFINMFTLRSLGALQDLVNRGKISGSKIRDFLEVTYGVRPSDDAMHISTYFGSKRIPIDFQTLQTMTDTYDAQNGNGQLVGQYSGNAKVNNEPFTVDFEVKDKMHGFFFITAEIQPKSSYTQGLSPEFKLLDREDFYLPEFDAMGVDAVPRSLLCNIDYNKRDNRYWTQVLNKVTSPDDIFGFCSRYARYKVNFDNVSGDYVIPSLNTGLDSWYLSRMFDLLLIKDDFPIINEKFLQAIGDDSNGSFDRIFSVANTSIDHFRTRFNIDLKMSRLMKSVRDSLEFENGGKTIEKSVNNGVQN